MENSNYHMYVINSEFEKVINEVYEMINNNNITDCYYYYSTIDLYMDLISETGKNGFANFIAKFNNNFDIIEYDYCDVIIKFGNVYIIIDYYCKDGTLIRAKVCDNCNDADNYYRSLN